jgi:mannose-6-phosphate isomerase-like protein (cupin superfamily)
MAQRRSVEILPSSGERAGLAFLREPLASDETQIAEVAPSTRAELFCHRHQTDQLMVLRGGIDLIVLQNKRLRRIALREDEPTWVRIPPGVPHGAINRGPAAAIVVNAVLRHRPSDGRDYQARPVPAALAAAWAELHGDRAQRDWASRD